MPGPWDDYADSSVDTAPWEDFAAAPPKQRLPAETSAAGNFAREAALTVLEPFYYKNLEASASAIPQGLRDIGKSVSAPNLPAGIEQAAGGVREAAGGAMGIAAPVVAAAGGALGAAALGPISKGLGYVGEKIKQGIEYVSPASKDYPQLTGLAADAAGLALVGKAGERFIPKAEPVERVAPEISEQTPRLPEALAPKATTKPWEDFQQPQAAEPPNSQSIPPPTQPSPAQVPLPESVAPAPITAEDILRKKEALARDMELRDADAERAQQLRQQVKATASAPQEIVRQYLERAPERRVPENQATVPEVERRTTERRVSTPEEEQVAREALARRNIPLPTESKAPPVGQAGPMNTADIGVDPDTFQFKLNTDEQGGGTLFSGIDPASAARAIKDLAGSIAPSREISVGDTQKGLQREHMGGLARSKEQAFHKLDPLIKQFDKQAPDDNLRFIDRMERGVAQPDPQGRQVAQTLREMLDDRREQIRALGTGKLENFIENYFPHVWENPTKATDVIKKVLLGKRPLQGPASFLKQRSIPTTAEGIAAGLKPVSYNPVELTLLKVHEMDRYLMAHRILADMKAEGTAKFVKLGGKVPEGWVSLNDNMFTVMNPTDEGMVIRGRYYAPAEAAQPLDRYLSPGLQGNTAYKAVRAYGNAMNQAQLGMSAFHLMFTSVDAATSDLALAFEKASRGHVKGAVKPAARALSLASPVTNYIKGSKLLKEYLSPGTYSELAPLADAVAKGGGRAFMDPFYRSDAVKGFWKAWKEGDWAKAGLKALPATFEYAAKPIMENIVPRQKLGVFANLAEDVLGRLGPDASKAEIRSALDKAWDSVDNRMGQLVYDNLFWNKTAKDLGMASVRSLGWNIGTAREIGGGLKDIATEGTRAIAGKKPELTHRAAYVMALPVVTGLVGAITQYLATGKGPSSLVDYYFPQNGGVLPNGKPARDSIASYMRDVAAFTHAPIETVTHKLHPMWEQVYEMLSNEDFYGTEIRHPDDPMVKQALEVAGYMGTQVVPFSVRNAEQAKRNLESPAAMAKGFFGITPAPAYLGQSPAERKAFELQGRMLPRGPRTKEAYESSQLRKQLRNSLMVDRPETKGLLGKAVGEGKVSRTQAQQITRDAQQSPLVRSVKDLPVEDAYTVWKLAGEKEKKALSGIMRTKIMNAHESRPPEQQPNILKIARDVFNRKTSEPASNSLQ